MTEKGDFLHPELTLAKFGIQLLLPELPQHYPYVLLMLFCSPGENQYVINEDDDTLF
jgi:hypothetical protein